MQEFSSTDKVVEVPIELLVDNPKNFFRNISEMELEDLCISISKVGVISPLLVTPNGDGKFRIVAGHQRRRALTKLEKKNAPVIIKENIDENTEELILIDSNVQTRQLSASEWAKSIERLKIIISEKRKTDPEFREKNKGVRARDIIAEQAGISPTQVERYDRLNKLIPEVKKLLDEEAITLTAAETFASLEPPVQKLIFKAIKEDAGKKITINMQKVLEKKDKINEELNRENDEMHKLVIRLQKELENKEGELKSVKGDEKKAELLKKEIEQLKIKKENAERDLIDLKVAKEHIEEEQKKKQNYGAEMMRPLNQPMKTLSSIQADVKYAAGKVTEDPYGGLERNLERYIKMMDEYKEIFQEVRDRLVKNKIHKEENKQCVAS